MTAVSSVASEQELQADHLYWRRALLSLLPLALAGFVPLWVCFALCGVVLLSLRFPAWAAVRPLLFMLLLSLGALPSLLTVRSGGLEAWVSFGLSFLLQFLLVVGLGFGLALLEEGRRRGVLFVLVPALFAPQWWLIPALAGALLGRGGPDDRFESQRAPTQRSMWQVTGAVLAALSLGALLLPQSRLQSSFTPPADSQAARRPVPTPPPDSAPSDGSAGGAGAIKPPTVPFTLEVDQKSVMLPLQYLLLLGVLLLPAAASLLLRGRGGKRAPVSLPEKLAVAGLVLTGLLLIVSALMATGGGGGSGAGADAGPLGELLSGPAQQLKKSVESQLHVNATAFFSGLAWATIFLLLVLIGFLYWRLWQARGPQAVAAAQAGDVPEERAAEPLAPLHRVRLAYRRAEQALRERGEARSETETALAYAERLAAGAPELAAPLRILTRAYEPVRYGGRVTEEDAAAAEAAADEIAAWRPLMAAPLQGVNG